MLITFLSHDLGTNCFGRAYLLAEMAARFAEVEIVGPSSTGALWEPLRDRASVPVRLLHDWVPQPRDLLAANPDVLYTVKTRRASLTAGLRAARQAGLPLIADADDWEMAFYYENPAWWVRQVVDVSDPVSYWATVRAQSLISRADAVTVSSTYLQRRFGGEIVVHARDGAWLDPARHDGVALRRELGLSDARVVMFSGSARPHKGLDDVLEVFERHPDLGATFVIVGSGMRFADRAWLRQIPGRPFSELPDVLAVADVIVVPQRSGPISRAQLPAKLIDALAMGVPVITTDVSDASAVVGDAGRVVRPDAPEELAAALHELVSDPGLAEQLGARARTRFVENFSFDAVVPRLQAVVDFAQHRARVRSAG
jgi:glycosyltransferase involved in cell wall biosynthesis